MEAKDRLIVALDVPDLASAQSLVDRLEGQVNIFKVGMQLYTAEGPKVLEMLQQKGKRVFLDLKFHDIPNTVAKAGESAVRQGVFMFNVHAAGGMKMMKETALACRRLAEQLGTPVPLMLAVTVLTSIDQEALNNEIGIPQRVDEQVAVWAKLAQGSGMDGVVASPQEIGLIRETCGKDFLIVTPGVRPRWAEINDQKRVMTPFAAIKAGADYVVVGRPITHAADPVRAVGLIVKEIEEGLQC